MPVWGMGITQTQKAGAEAGLRKGLVEARLEAVVHAGLDDIRAELDVGREAASRGAAGRGAEIDVVVFELGRPRAHEGVFDASAEHVAELAFGFRSAGRVGRLDVAVSRAARDVGQEAVPGVADAAAAGGEVAVAGFAAGAAAADGGRGGGALHPAVV